jgi:HD-GYP domain-containing protein (c-di-GMP phosphodiesterase class II)
VLLRAVDFDFARSQKALDYGFLLHDVGKIAIPDEILLKPGPLSPSERKHMRTHTIIGEAMLRGIGILQGEPLRVVRSHHERWDGRGYPDGLAGTQIPLGARVFAVADALDAMTSDRPYRPAGTWAGARDAITSQSGRHFDPAVVQAFVKRESALLRVHRELFARAGTEEQPWGGRRGTQSSRPKPGHSADRAAPID